MNIICDSIQAELLELGWTAEQRVAARRVLQHMETCEACRTAFDDYAAMRAAAGPPASGAPDAEPVGGWEAFEQRMAGTIKRKPFFIPWRAIAASLLIAITGINAWMVLKDRPEPNVKVTRGTEARAIIASDMQPASVVEAFRTVSKVFEGKANWVMLSENGSELGLASESEPASEVLVLRFVVTRGNTAVSQIHLGVIPGATVRVSVPGSGGEQLQYVISTDAANHQNVSVSLALETGGKSTGLGSMATTLNMPIGKQTNAGQITTRNGTFDLAMSLEKAAGA